jgi:hypothetical protein
VPWRFLDACQLSVPRASLLPASKNLHNSGPHARSSVGGTVNSVGASGLVGLTLFEIRDERAELRVRRIEAEQRAGVPKRRGEIPVPCNRDERHQDVPIL